MVRFEEEENRIDDESLCILGDILVFMPGQEDIEVTCELIKGLSLKENKLNKFDGLTRFSLF